MRTGRGRGGTSRSTRAGDARDRRAARAGDGCSPASASRRGARRGPPARPSGPAAGPRASVAWSRTNRAMSVATWSLRERAVWSLPPTGPTISVRRRSIAMWMSSSAGWNSNVPRSSSDRRPRRAPAAARRPRRPRGSRPRRASSRAPWTGATSYGARRRSKGSTRSVRGTPGPADHGNVTWPESMCAVGALPRLRDGPDLHQQHRAEQIEAHTPPRERPAAARVQAVVGRAADRKHHRNRDHQARAHQREPAGARQKPGQ